MSATQQQARENGLTIVIPAPVFILAELTA
jgi:hypothetical protein